MSEKHKHQAAPDTAATPEIERQRRSLWRNAKIMVPVWIAIVALIFVALHFDIDARLIAGGVVLVALLSQAFAWLIGIIALVPVIGPLIVKVLAIPLIWLLNAVGYLISVIAIKRGYSKDVLTYRGMTIALIVGIVIGYILGKLI